MKGNAARALGLACCIVVLPVSAERNAGGVDSDGSTQLSRAIELGNKARVRRRTGKDALHWAAFYGDEAGIEGLIVSGADINGRIRKGATPLHLAAFNGHTRVVKLLIDHGAKVNARTKAGITPLGWAQRNGHTEVVELLIARGAKAGRTPPAGFVMPEPQSSVRENPQPALQHRRVQAPLKYSLMGAPESVFATMDSSQDEAAGQAKAVEQKKPAGGFRVQLAAVGSDKGAAKAWSSLRARHPDILGGRELIVDKSLVKGKNYFRVQTGPMSRSDARSICERLKKVNQSCLVVGKGSS